MSKDFYKESADGNWKCEIQVKSSDDGLKDIFDEVTFINDKSEIASEGIYRTGKLVYNRTFKTSPVIWPLLSFPNLLAY